MKNQKKIALLKNNLTSSIKIPPLLILDNKMLAPLIQPLNLVGQNPIPEPESFQELSNYIQLLKAGVKESLCLTGHEARVRCMSLHENKIVTGSDDQTLKLFSISQKQLLATSSKHPAWIFSVVFNTNGTQILSGCGDGTLKI